MFQAPLAQIQLGNHRMNHEAEYQGDALIIKLSGTVGVGSHTLEVLHTPGHTSGSICLYEFGSKVLFSGDTMFAGGTLSYIAESGSIGDYINSITRLEARKISRIYPGHGKVSLNPEEDLARAILNAKKLLEGNGEVSISPFRPAVGKDVNEGLSA